MIATAFMGCGPATPPTSKTGASGAAAIGADIYMPASPPARTTPQEIAAAAQNAAREAGASDTDAVYRTAYVEALAAQKPAESGSGVKKSGSNLTQNLSSSRGGGNRYFVLVGQATFRDLEEQEAAFKDDWKKVAAKNWLRVSLGGSTLYSVLVLPEYPEGFDTEEDAAYVASNVSQSFGRKVGFGAAGVIKNPRFIEKSE